MLRARQAESAPDLDGGAWGPGVVGGPTEPLGRG